MATTINFYLRTERTNARGESPIYIRVTHNRKSSIYSIGIAVQAKDWNEDKQRVRRSHDSYKKMNHEIDRMFTKAQNKMLELRAEDNVSAKYIINVLKGYEAKNFFTYGEEYIDRLEESGSVRLSKQTNVIVNKIEKFYGDKSLLLNEVDNKFLSGLQSYMKKECKNAPNTIRKDLERLNRLFEEAKKDNLIKSNPIDDFELPKRQKSNKTALTLKQIKDIEKLDLKKSSRLWHTRNYFLFSFYNAGIRVGDLMKLKRENIFISDEEIRLRYLMNKTRTNTKPKWKNIKQLPQAIEILERYNFQDKDPEEYLFPILDTSKNLQDPSVFDRDKQSKTAMMNRDLDDIAGLADIEENVTTHIARHSFANFARKKGMSLYSISKALAHSNLKTTEQYLNSFDEEMLDNEMEELFN
ncbi:site-specific integrase [Fodinibius sediminis]|uniref:Site-specific recombinase XerD n=1 Tax=Fodinibius sediminis TaxID=1214077 RepID=A0A521CBW1_9BACT|nr:site-specific integrase [Fodinibius sediminis]SMO56845.1 Site-specific recombinase XerD [Fodinibius sediminis]